MARARSFVDRFLANALIALALIAAGWTGEAGAQNRPQQGARAPSGWTLCNETSFVLEAATGKPSGRAVQIEGWKRIRPGECVLAMQGALTRGVHYVYARTSDAHRGGRREWGGDSEYCVNATDDATFRGESSQICQQPNSAMRGFRKVLINKRDSWRTSFAEAGRLSVYGARTQGINRLIVDAGLEFGNVGADPRRVAAALQRLRTEARLAANASEAQIIDELERIAERRARDIGLRLCNKTPNRVWASVARRKGEGWESRGWWPLAPNGCSRVLDEVLTPGNYFVHAMMESAQGERYLAKPGESFCTSPSRFAILGRERCEPRYYNDTLFVPFRIETSGMTVEFSDRDFLPFGQSQPRALTAQATPDITPQAGGIVRGVAPASAGEQGTLRDMVPGLGAPPSSAPPKSQPQQRPSGALRPTTPQPQNPPS
jgi:uncharacterized membrane protein